MKFSTRLSDAAHMLVFIYLEEGDKVTSAAMATSIHTNPAYIRQLMSKLKGAGLILCRRGVAATSLARAPEEITLFDIYRAVEGEKPLLHLDTNVNPACGIGINVQVALRTFYDDVQTTAEDKMKTITLRNVIDRFLERIQGTERRT